jgi:hypothetical protein
MLWYQMSVPNSHSKGLVSESVLMIWNDQSFVISLSTERDQIGSQFSLLAQNVNPVKIEYFVIACDHAITSGRPLSVVFELLHKESLEL